MFFLHPFSICRAVLYIRILGNKPGRRGDIEGLNAVAWLKCFHDQLSQLSRGPKWPALPEIYGSAHDPRLDIRAEMHCEMKTYLGSVEMIMFSTRNLDNPHSSLKGAMTVAQRSLVHAVVMMLGTSIAAR